MLEDLGAESQDAENQDAESQDAESQDAESQDAENQEEMSNDYSKIGCREYFYIKNYRGGKIEIIIL